LTIERKGIIHSTKTTAAAITEQKLNVYLGPTIRNDVERYPVVNKLCSFLNWK
jgi:hypothetical protein